jgi:hypothetical protein
MQVLDKDGNELLKGGSTVHYRVNWLLLDSWLWGQGVANTSEITFTVSGDSPAIPALRAAYSGNTRVKWSKAVIECFKDNVVDSAHLIMRRTFEDPVIRSMKASDTSGGGSSWEFIFIFPVFTTEYRSPHAEDASDALRPSPQ